MVVTRTVSRGTSRCSRSPVIHAEAGLRSPSGSAARSQRPCSGSRAAPLATLESDVRAHVAVLAPVVHVGVAAVVDRARLDREAALGSPVDERQRAPGLVVAGHTDVPRQRDRSRCEGPFRASCPSRRGLLRSARHSANGGELEPPRAGRECRPRRSAGRLGACSTGSGVSCSGTNAYTARRAFGWFPGA